MGKRSGSFLVITAAFFLCAFSIYQLLFTNVLAQEGPNWHKGLPKQYKSKWLVHDLNRPKPRPVTPGTKPGEAPSDAIVLFNGKDMSQWVGTKRGIWKVEKGYMEVNNTGNIRSLMDPPLWVVAETPRLCHVSGLSRHGTWRSRCGSLPCSGAHVRGLDRHDLLTYRAASASRACLRAPLRAGQTR